MRPSIVVATLVVAACASSGTTPAATPTRDTTIRVMGNSGLTQITTTAVGDVRVGTVERPFAEVWQALPQIYESLGIDVASRDEATGTMGNPGFRARRRLGSTPISRFLDCGRSQGGPSADTYDIHFSVMTEVRKDTDQKTTVSTRVEAVARPVNFAAEPVRCSSLGELENRIHIALMAG